MIRAETRPAARPGLPHLVFFHALGGAAWLWEGVAARMPDGWGVTLYDLRGHGGSGGAGETMAAHAADLLALAPPGAVACGLSIGGQIALRAALDRPGHLAGLVLCATLPRIGSRGRYAARVDRIRAEGLAPFAAEQARRWVAPAFAAAHPATAARAAATIAAQPLDGYAAACAAIGATDLWDRLAEVATPALCLSGAEDASCPPTEMARMAAALGAAHRTLPTGHLPPVEAPDAVAAAVAAFAATFVEGRQAP